MTVATQNVFRFADFEVRELEFCATRSGHPLAIEPKAFRVLLYLLHHAGHLVPKEELFKAVWGDTAVTDNSLTRAIALLRRVLEDDPHQPHFIETVATAGYRFICPVNANEGDLTRPAADADQADRPNAIDPVAQSEHVPSPSVSVRPTSVLKRAWFISIAVLVVAALAVWYFGRPSPPLRITEYNQITHDGQQKILVGTDGNRLYLQQLNPQRIAQVPAAAGRVVPIPVEVRDPWLLDVSPDGSTLLVESAMDASLWKVDVLGTSTRRLGTADTAAWSPDMKWIAYVPRGLSPDIYIARSDGSDPRALHVPRPPGLRVVIIDLAWSPDGKRIRFSQSRALWEISATGSDLHPILPNWRASSWKCCGRWTPDGKFYVFLSGEDLLQGGTVLPGAQLWAIDERHGLFQQFRSEPIQLTSGPTRWSVPILSRDGRTLFARGVTLRGELVRFDQASHEFRPYLRGMSAEYLSFSRDGKSLVYTTFPEGILWRANLDGGDVVQLTEPPFIPTVARWSPDGSQVLFTDRTANVDQILYVVSAQGGPVRRLIPGDEKTEQDGNWSPDGKEVVFTSCCDGPDKLPRLRILNVASGSVRMVPGSEAMFSPRWSPDGRWIVAIHRVQRELWRFEVETQKWTSLWRGSVDWPTFSHDGQFIYFLKVYEDPGIFRVPARGGTPEKIVDTHDMKYTGRMAFWMGLDLNDDPLLLRDAGTDDIYALTLERR